MNREVSKIAKLGSLVINEDELAKINEFTLNSVTEKDVFVYKIVVADNELEYDRDFEPLTLSALEDLQKHLVGKTMIFDHNPSAENQVARIYETFLEKSEKLTSGGEPSAKLIAKCYMIRTAKNADLIAEISGGIKKEVSVGFRATSFRCSICGKDGDYTYRCSHRKGESYGGKICYNLICGATDAYEVSFVAVPCQPNAGTTKSFETADETEEVLNARIKLNENFIFNTNMEV